MPKKNHRTILAVVGVSDPGDQNTVQSSLGSCYEIVHTPGWKGAAKLLRQRPLGIILCEASLPDGNWRDVLKLAQDHPKKPEVVVCSLHADDRLWAEALNLGAYDVLASPLDFQEVSRVLGRQRFTAAAWTTAMA